MKVSIKVGQEKLNSSTAPICSEPKSKLLDYQDLCKRSVLLYIVWVMFVGNGNLKVSDMQVKMLREKGRSEDLEYQEN